MMTRVRPQRMRTVDAGRFSCYDSIMRIHRISESNPQMGSTLHNLSYTPEGNTRMRRYTAALLILLTGCTATQGAITPHTTTTRPQDTPALRCMPLVPHSDYDPDGALFERWADDATNLDYQPQPGGYGAWVNEYGHTMGYADAEDAAIYADPSCLPSQN